MRVNSSTKVNNLSADKLDGKDSSEIGRELWAHVNSDGTLVRGNGVQSSGRFGTGHYYVSFNRDVSFCGYVATTTDAYAGPTGTVQGASPTVFHGRCPCTPSSVARERVRTCRSTWQSTADPRPPGA